MSERQQPDPADMSESLEVTDLSWQDRIICGDARQMCVVPDGAVSLVITSPPY